MPVGLSKDAVRRTKAKARLYALIQTCHPRREHAVVRGDEQIEARPLEADHVASELLADHVARRLILELPVARSRCEELVSRYVGPTLPTGLGQDLSRIVVAAVPIAHQKLDKATIGVVKLFFSPPETHPRAVCDRQIVSHRSVQSNEAVVKNGYGVVGYHSLDG